MHHSFLFGSQGSNISAERHVKWFRLLIFAFKNFTVMFWIQNLCSQKSIARAHWATLLLVPLSTLQKHLHALPMWTSMLGTINKLCWGDACSTCVCIQHWFQPVALATQMRQTPSVFGQGKQGVQRPQQHRALLLLIPGFAWFLAEPPSLFAQTLLGQLLLSSRYCFSSCL